MEQYGYHHGNAVNLGTVMPVAQFRVTDEEGSYLCVAWALIYEGSILAYNPTRDEAEWIPVHGITNDLSHGEERSLVMLENFVPRVLHEADCIVQLGARCLVGWSDDPSSEEEDDEPTKGEDGEPKGDEHEEAEGQEEADPDSSPGRDGTEHGKTREEAEPWER